MSILIRALTDLGLKRSRNEDRHAIWVAPASPGRVDPEVLALVADGMGGAQSGEIASGMVAEAVVRRYQEAGGADPAATLAAAFQEANGNVFARSEIDGEYHGMGTTCTAIVVRGHRAWIAHVGDSRAYLVRSGVARQLTRDHSIVAELVRRGELTEEQARSDPRRNVVTRSMGIASSVAVDVVSPDADLQPGDTVVLCTDGLHSQISDAEIAAAFRDGEPEEACSRLVDLALGRGGPDNITIVVLAIEGNVAGLDAGLPPDPDWERPEARARSAVPLTTMSAIDKAVEPLARVGHSRADDSPDLLDALPEFPTPPAKRTLMRGLLIALLGILALIGLALAIRWVLPRFHRTSGHEDKAAAHAGVIAVISEIPCRRTRNRRDEANRLATADSLTHGVLRGQKGALGLCR